MYDNSRLATALPEAASDALAPVRDRLHKLQSSPPQVLLFDGGTEEQRRGLATYWAACTLCESAVGSGPCLSCHTCRQILDDADPDIIALDGALSQKEAGNEDYTGLFRPFNADSSRDLRVRLRAAPHGRYWFVMITGISGAHPAAPNALLKVLEEPSRSALFVLLVPQRDQILPTLVSRALCLTLPWPEDRHDGEDVRPLLTGLVRFLADQDDFLAMVSARSFLTAPLAREFFLACQSSLIRVLAGQPDTELDHVFARLPLQRQQQCILWIREAQDMLRSPITPVSPLRVLVAFSMRLYTCFR